MEFTFDGNQEYQLTAIESVVNLFQGQPRVGIELNFDLTAGLAASVANRLDLSEEQLLQNLRDVQESNGLSRDDALDCIEETIQTGEGDRCVRFFNFSVEMETGTGKTYVYVRTALELYRRYGIRKFIVVVPSVAIREGVLKDLTITSLHFRDLYGNLPYRYYAYNSESLSHIRQFALSDSVELMVMTIDAFNRASNVIRQTTDRLQGETPIHMIQACRPVLILDEPQNMESEVRIRALAALNPLFALRYSATHRNPYNVVYRLTPYDAYKEGLVKRIEVASVVTRDDVNRPFVRLDRIDVRGRRITARVAVHKLMRGGRIRETTVTVRPGDSLADKARRPEYEGLDIDEINPGGQFLRFASGLELRVGESSGADKDAIFEAQIRYTIEEHFRKQRKLRPHGIKVLSLFFIDRVANYAPEDGLIRTLFKRAFEEHRQDFLEWKDVPVERVQAAYFAQQRRRGGQVDLLDSVSGEAKQDEAAYDLIMRDKERLLGFDEPVSFIFSHSALREGWDNPNVFQICTLNQTASEVKKRQEVGRGVRLARDQEGNRVHDERVNVLTVVANESYEHYVAQLQAETEQEYGKEGVPPKPANARERGVAKLRKAHTLSPEFKGLWEQISRRTRYAVKIDSEKLLGEVLPSIDAIKVRTPRVAVTKAQVRVGSANTFEALQVSAAKTVASLTGRYPLPNLIEIMANLMEATTPPVRLTRRTLLELFLRTSNKAAVLENPHEFATEAVRIIKERLADHLVAGIRYEKVDDWYEMTQLQLEIESWKQYMVPAKRSVYDHVTYDSQIEKDFVEGLEKRDDVKLYLKLPSWFTVPTPIGEYNPDWALVMEDRDEHGKSTRRPLLYLVRETKDENFRKNPRPSERRKIACAERHFGKALGVSYAVVTLASELP